MPQCRYGGKKYFNFGGDNRKKATIYNTNWAVQIITIGKASFSEEENK